MAQSSSLPVWNSTYISTKTGHPTLALSLGDPIFRYICSIRWTVSSVPNWSKSGWSYDHISAVSCLLFHPECGSADLASERQISGGCYRYRSSGHRCLREKYSLLFPYLVNVIFIDNLIEAQLETIPSLYSWATFQVPVPRLVATPSREWYYKHSSPPWRQHQEKVKSI